MVLEIKVAQNDPKNIFVAIIDHITVFGPFYVDFKIWPKGNRSPPKHVPWTLEAERAQYSYGAI